jgi:hypothetical protein
MLQTLNVEAILQPRKIIVMDDTTTVNEALKVGFLFVFHQTVDD